MQRLFAPDEAATEAIGIALAGQLVPGDIVTLEGDLGVGKTALARAMIRARLGDPDMEVPSPSFAIVQPYTGILHADLYRLADESELIELGLMDDEDDILLVEWPQRAPSLFERPGLRIAIAMAPTGRVLTVEAAGRDAPGLAAALAPWRQAEPQ